MILKYNDIKLDLLRQVASQYIFNTELETYMDIMVYVSNHNPKMYSLVKAYLQPSVNLMNLDWSYIVYNMKLNTRYVPLLHEKLKCIEEGLIQPEDNLINISPYIDSKNNLIEQDGDYYD